ncbi:hypothetical protein [Parasediminibacterium sp. JCM 36343]
MDVDINALLALPQKDKRRIAEKLWDSLLPNNSIVKEDIETINLLENKVG